VQGSSIQCQRNRSFRTHHYLSHRITVIPAKAGIQ
jgi:hypothetical protein